LYALHCQIGVEQDLAGFRVRDPAAAKAVDAGGTAALRYRSRLRHMAVGRANKGRRVVLLVVDRDDRVLSAEGEILRRLMLDPSRRTSRLASSSVYDVSRHLSPMS
jgi:hypothetical protein